MTGPDVPGGSGRDGGGEVVRIGDDALATIAADAPIPPLASLVVESDPDTRTAFTARWVADAVAEVVRRRGRAVLALVGGSSVAAVHRALVDVDLDWSSVTITLADERAVPADSADRNMRVVEPLTTALRDRGAITDDQVVDLGEVPAEASPPDVEAALSDLRARVERVDVALLGLGPDGHVASLFPGHPGLTATGTFTVVEDAPKPPPLRMSATVGVLAGADAVALVGFGDAKADAVADVVREGSLAERPGRIVHLPRRGVVVTDRLPE